MAFIDARCLKCKSKIGWSGTYLDMPPCRRCGYQVPKEQLEENERKFQQTIDEMFSKKPGEIDGSGI